MSIAPDELRTFEEQRPRLFATAYRMLGSASEAEDAVQDTYLRWDAADRAAVREPAAWLTRVLTNLCVTRLTSATELAESHPALRVRLLTGAEPGAALSTRAREHLRRVFDRLGVDVRSGTTVAEVRPDAVVLAGGETVASDLTAWATGFSAPLLAARCTVDDPAPGSVRASLTDAEAAHLPSG